MDKIVDCRFGKYRYFYVFLCLFFELLSIRIVAQEYSNFRHLSPVINNRSVQFQDVFQDQLGYMWMINNGRVKKYDGYSYLSIRVDSIFENPLSNDIVFKGVKDLQNNIWLISKNGLVAVYNIEVGFKSPKWIQGIKVQSISFFENNVFIASKTGGIYRYDLFLDRLEKLTTIPNIFSNKSEITGLVCVNRDELFIAASYGKVYNYNFATKKLEILKAVFSDFLGNVRIIADTQGRIWIGTEIYGVFVYDPEKKEFIQNRLFKKPLYNIKNEMVISMFCDHNGTMWIGTDGGGLYRVQQSGAINLYTYSEINNFSLSSNTIIAIYEDKHRNVWILPNYGSINILVGANNTIGYHQGTENHIPSRVLSVHKTKNGDLWVGTDGQGITRIQNFGKIEQKEKQFFKPIGHEKGMYVQTIVEDSSSNIWFGTYKNGLWHYDTKTSLFDHIRFKNQLGQPVTDVRTIFKDSKNRIWVGSNIAINVYTDNKRLLATFLNNTKGLKGLVTESIIEDKQGGIWIGNLKGGLFKLNEDMEGLNNSFFTYHSYFDEITFDKDVLGITYMSLGEGTSIWLVSNCGVLIEFDTQTGEYTSHRQLNRRANIKILSVLVQDAHNLWLSCYNGIVHYNTLEKSVNRFHDVDGLQDNLFLPRAALKTENGEFYFGGIKGVSHFDPSKIKKTITKANLVINALEVLNKPAGFLIPNQIKNGIEQLKSIVLEADQSSFSFRFSAIDNILKPRFRYAYRLKGFNDDWVVVRKERLATYTNIPYGDYVFEVKAGSKEGGWDVGVKRISIHIKPPFWRTIYAYIIYLFIFILIFYSLIKGISLRRELISGQVISQKEKELHKVKMDFFSKISHEIQTPLTLIISPIDDMLNRAELNGNRLLQQRLQIISNNVKRLSRIVFELTTVRNKELGNARLFVSKNDLCHEISKISISFQEQARLKNIDFSVNCPQNLKEVWYDTDKVEHILYNLLSNAFKFTPKEGNIQLMVVPINNKNSIKISISDSGPGISNDELESIFNLFYQSEMGKKHKGMGIGLALTKDLVDLHRGKIDVSSSPIEGTVFTVVLPISEDAYLEEERVVAESNIKTIDGLFPIQESIKNFPVPKISKTVLVVEDNIELQLFLKDLLLPLYQVLVADNGEEGYESAKANHPDLILSDIMMPVLDGLEMAKLLQKDVLTQHIPVVLLTAKNTTNSKIIGLQSGAIEFIKKPFDTKELMLKINNIMVTTEHIISKFRKEIISQPIINIEKSQDDVFLESLIAVINSKLEDPNFKMEELADALHMSYSVLYRKCHGLTNKSLVDLVRFLRLKKAAVVIAKFGYSVADAAYISGFNDPKYFSKCFKKNFKKTPNAFKKEAQEMGSEACLKKYKLDVF